jgi:hypothetical protein
MKHTSFSWLLDWLCGGTTGSGSKTAQGRSRILALEVLEDRLLPDVTPLAIVSEMRPEVWGGTVSGLVQTQDSATGDRENGTALASIASIAGAVVLSQGAIEATVTEDWLATTNHGNALSALKSALAAVSGSVQVGA